MENVIKLKPQSGYDDILFFLNGLEAEATVTRYKKSIERFIKKEYGIPLEHVQPDHFNNLTYTQMKKYRDYLRRKYSASTTNNEMTAIFNLLKELNRVERDGKYVYSINIDRIRTKALRVKEVDSSGDVSWEEVQSWITYIKNSDLPKKENKWILLHTAVITGLRKEALAQLTFRDLRKSDTWQLKSTLKGKTKHVSLKEEDAELLLSLQEDKNDKDEKIFGFGTRTMDRLLDNIKDVFSVNPDRKVTFHSLRGLSIFESFLSSNNNILIAQSHALHSKMETTYNYIKSRTDASEAVTLYMGKEFKYEDVEDVSQEQWMKIYNKLSRSAKYEIKSIMDELGYSRE